MSTPVITDAERDLAAKMEVLRDMEDRVRELMESHERKRELWYPSELLAAEPDTCPDEFVSRLRAQAEGIPDPVRAAIALNTLTEEGLPHFHRLLSVYLGDASYWRLWNNLWTAEEDRHGAVLHDYCRAEGLDAQESIAYADSTSDLPLLEAVGFPVAVNPETRLAAIARKRGWLVEHWAKAPGGPRPLLPIGPQTRRTSFRARSATR